MSPPRLYTSGSSYYSMIARLSLVEAGVAFESRPTDIHRRLQQLEPSYVRLNPNMTVPTLDLGDRCLFQSRDIVLHAFGKTEDTLDAETRRLLDLHYGFEIEDLTIGWLLHWNALARRGVPAGLAKVEKRLRELALENPELSDAYLRRAEVFAGRRRTFDPAGVVAMYASRRAQAGALLDGLERTLQDGRQFLSPPSYGPADVVWTTFLARIHFIRQHDLVTTRPAVARYEAAMFARPSFERADIWARVHPLKLLRQMI